MPEESVVDLPEIEAPEIEVATDAPEVAEHEAAKPEETEEPKVDGRKVPQWIKNLQKVDPGAYTSAKDTYFAKLQYDERLKDFDLDGTKAFLEEHGGRESLASALTEMQAKVGQLDTITQSVQEARPELVNDMADMAGENFPKLAVAVMQKWAQANPENYDAAISGAFAQTIASANIPAFLDRMELMLKYGDTASFGASLGQLRDWAASFGNKASVSPIAQSQQGQQKGETAEDVRKQVAADKWRSDTTAARGSLISAELGHYSGKNPDPDLKDIATDRITSLVMKQMKDDAAYQKSLTSLTSRGDYAGAMQLFKSREGKAVKEIAPTVARKIYGSPAPAPKVEAPAAKPAAPRRPTVPQSKANKFDQIWAS
jgi:hypothetical protein